MAAESGLEYMPGSEKIESLKPSQTQTVIFSHLGAPSMTVRFTDLAHA